MSRPFVVGGIGGRPEKKGWPEFSLRISHINFWHLHLSRRGVGFMESETRFVQVNGSSMLYGMAREHIRSLTAAGPWGAIILPTMSFYDNKETAQKRRKSDQDSISPTECRFVQELCAFGATPASSFKMPSSRSKSRNLECRFFQAGHQKCN